MQKISRTLMLMLVSALILQFGLGHLLQETSPLALRLISAITILIFGALYPLTRAAEIIETATDILSKKTHLAAGLLQSVGTAFPDMILGLTAAIISLSLLKDNPDRAVSYAMIAAATTFGSNIYNIGHAIWCIHRQNRADILNKKIRMFPYIDTLGWLKPLKTHKQKPQIKEIDIAIRLLTILTMLTASVALLMVTFGKVTPTLYQLVKPAGIGLCIAAISTLYHFRQISKESGELEAAEVYANPLMQTGMANLWFALAIAGITIAFTANSMVHALETLSLITHIPYVVAGTLAGLVGCLGEMLVVHNYSIHQNGRLGDAIVGVAMDNIVTIMGASLVAILGGIFLGGTSLIILFVLILTLNTILIDQISVLKTTLIKLR